MSFSHRVVLIVGILFFLLGAVLFLNMDTTTEPPPRMPNRASLALKETQTTFPSPESMTGPWIKAHPPVLSKPAPVVPPAAKAPDPVDKKSVSFLGSYREQDGSPAYFFKFLPSGSVIILKPGQTNKGWQLVEIQDHVFTLTGPGGRFEVSH